MHRLSSSSGTTRLRVNPVQKTKQPQSLHFDLLNNICLNVDPCASLQVFRSKQVVETVKESTPNPRTILRIISSAEVFVVMEYQYVLAA